MRRQTNTLDYITDQQWQAEVLLSQRYIVDEVGNNERVGVGVFYAPEDVIAANSAITAL
jgi:hypothetical protein